jgi:hypothetical protein
LGKPRQRVLGAAVAVTVLAACSLAATGSGSAWVAPQQTGGLRAGRDVRAPARLGAQKVEALGQPSAAAGAPTALLGAGLLVWAAVSRSQRAAGRGKSQTACRVSLAAKSCPLPVAAEPCLPVAAAEVPSLRLDLDDEVAPVAAPLAPQATFAVPAPAPVIGQTAEAAENVFGRKAAAAARGRRTRRNAFNGEREQRRNIGARLQERPAAEPRVVSYDVSRVPMKMQLGLQMEEVVCESCNREARVQNDSNALTFRVDTVSQLKVTRLQRRTSRC